MKLEELGVLPCPLLVTYSRLYKLPHPEDQGEETKTPQVETDFIFLGSKITVDGNCSHEIKRHLLLGRKATANLDTVLKSKDIILPTKVCIAKAVVFPVVMYRCESLTIKKAECQRMDAFELWC